jgi:CHASE2 domain-containing sensor protein
MHLRIPTWLIFAFLVVASFAPVVSLRPGWWLPYYGALMMCWVLVVVAALRQADQEDRDARHQFLRTLRRLQDAHDQ